MIWQKPLADQKDFQDYLDYHRTDASGKRIDMIGGRINKGSTRPPYIGSEAWAHANQRQRKEAYEEYKVQLDRLIEKFGVLNKEALGLCASAVGVPCEPVTVAPPPKQQ